MKRPLVPLGKARGGTGEADKPKSSVPAPDGNNGNNGDQISTSCCLLPPPPFSTLPWDKSTHTWSCWCDHSLRPSSVYDLVRAKLPTLGSQRSSLCNTEGGEWGFLSGSMMCVLHVFVSRHIVFPVSGDINDYYELTMIGKCLRLCTSTCQSQKCRCLGDMPTGTTLTFISNRPCWWILKIHLVSCTGVYSNCPVQEHRRSPDMPLAPTPCDEDGNWMNKSTPIVRAQQLPHLRTERWHKRTRWRQLGIRGSKLWS